jgi:hypothetical protein
MPHDPKKPDSPTHRQIQEQLRSSARARGAVDHDAEAALESPEYPAWIEYLATVSRRLHGRSGDNMNGLSPLSEATVAYYQANSGVLLTADDVDALMELDIARRAPDSVLKRETDQPTTKLTKRGRDLWPSREAVQ